MGVALPKVMNSKQRSFMVALFLGFIFGLLSLSYYCPQVFGQAGQQAVLLGLGGEPTDATPTFSPGAGTYSSTQSVTISTVTSGATLCYTTDGTTPTATVPGTCRWEHRIRHR